MTARSRERALCEAALRRLAKPKWPFASLEQLVTSTDGFGLSTATPVQIAVCRILAGVPLDELADDPQVKEALNGAAPSGQYAEVVVVAAVRCAKSLIAAALGIWASQTVDTAPMTSDGDIARFSIASLEKDNAKQVLAHLLGASYKPAIAPFVVSRETMSRDAKLVKDSGSDLMGSVFFRSPSGKPFEVRVIAGKRAGGSAVSKWSGGMVLDEAPRMLGASEGVVNYDDMRKAVLSRLLPGAVLFSIGSPWAPRGPIYDYVTKEWGKPQGQRIVVKARGPAMNPFWWTPERCEALKKADPDAYKTDVLAEFVDEEDSLFPQEVMSRQTMSGVTKLPFVRGQEYVAAIDPASRVNAWTLVIGTRTSRRVTDVVDGEKVSKLVSIKQVALARDWRPKGEPLRPRIVLREIGEILRDYEIDWVYTDQWSADALVDLGEEYGVELVVEEWTASNKTKAFLGLSQELAAGRVEVLDHPDLIRDLTIVKRRATHMGVTIDLPRTPDGRHADYAPPVAKVFARWIDEAKDPPPAEGTTERLNWEAQRRKERAAAAAAADAGRPWWDPG